MDNTLFRNMPTCMAHHPGPDPKKDPLGWRPLCGKRIARGWRTSPRADEVTCHACLRAMGGVIHEEPA